MIYKLKNIIIMKTGTKIVLSGIVGLILTLLIASQAKVPEQKAQNVGGGFAVDQAYYITPGTGTAMGAGAAEATTTPAYLTTADTATSTVKGFAGRATNIDLYLGATASTSATSKLQYFVSFSPNNVDWYKEDCSSIDTTILVTHGATACVHQWTITGSGYQTKNITIGATQAKYFKIDFGVTGANASLWAAAVPRDENPN